MKRNKPHRLGVRVASRWSDSEGLSDSEDEDAWSECGENSGRSDGSEEEEDKREKKPKTAAPKLWTKEQFPEGVVGPANYWFFTTRRRTTSTSPHLRAGGVCHATA